VWGGRPRPPLLNFILLLNLDLIVTLNLILIKDMFLTTLYSMAAAISNSKAAGEGARPTPAKKCPIPT
jgi:hypothetical protein